MHRGCKLQIQTEKGLNKDGDIIIGGHFPLLYTNTYPEATFAQLPQQPYWKTFEIRTFRWGLAMMYAIDEINRSWFLLPNVSLGYSIHASCSMEAKALQGIMCQLSGKAQPVPNFCCWTPSSASVIIGDSLSVTSIPMARILGLYLFPQISYGATVPILSDKYQFPSFFRTTPRQDYQSFGLAGLMVHFGWTWVGILVQDNDFGLLGSQSFKPAIVKAGVCIAFTELLPILYSKTKTRHIIEVIQKSSTNVIVVISTESSVIPVMEEASRMNITGKVWIAYTSWSNAPSISKKEFSNTLTGTLGFALHRGLISGFKDLLYSLHPLRYPENIFVRPFWEELFGCKWPDSNATQAGTVNIFSEGRRFCSGEEKLEELNIPFFDVLNLRVTYSTYMAVYAAAYALHGLLSCKPGKGPFNNGTCANIQNIKPWQAPMSVCSEHCRSGHRKAVREGEPACCFECVQCSEGEIANETDSSECLKCNDDYWSNEKQDKCIPKSIEFLAYSEPLGLILAVISIFYSCLTVVIFIIFWKYNATPIVKANNRSLSYFLLIALILCFLCSLIFIGYPIPATCMFRQVTFGTIFAFCISCVLAKTITVVIAFRASRPGSKLREWMGLQLPIALILTFLCIQVVICVVWLCTTPPYPEFNMKSITGTITVECNEGSTSAFWIVLGYMGGLASVSFVVAFLARKLPASFNEAKYITFSMFVFVIVWLSFIPAYLSTRGKYMVAVEIFAILSSSTGLLSCIFFPKCYIILLRPDMNSKEYLMEKGAFDKNKHNQ
ncbi:extracellular calcium-sensing receptor-like [Protopterus annectens]|uniref:extracellular calcium-sensing receptor-like n=1 Tax=Protopterus annectens TaxID=7888 RepID=UPI001CFA9181|nr:extracellular calcium-sensing receptor-like [Protopterus annectens]